MAIFGDTLVVPDMSDNEVQPASGAVYVFERVNDVWQLEAKLKANTPIASDRLGVAVAVRPGLVLASSTRHNERRGAVYVFRKSGSSWVEEAKLEAPGGNPLDSFGNVVALGDGFALVGESGHDTVEYGENSGAAFLFENVGSQWTFQTQFISPPEFGAAGDGFGNSVATYGSRIAIGAVGARFPPEDETGLVVTYQNVGGTWILEGIVRPDPFPKRDIAFGAFLALFEDELLIGATNDFIDTERRGGAYNYHFDGTNWISEGNLTGLIGFPFNPLRSIARWGNIAVIGLPTTSTSVPGNGIIMIFRKESGSWSLQDSFAKPDVDGFFGQSVAIFGDQVWAGSHLSGDVVTAFEVEIPCEDFLPCTIDTCSASGCSYTQVVGCGDLNCDGFASISDIGAFVLAITDPVGYDAQFPECEILGADCSGDGLVTISDISCFIALLTL